MTNQQIAIHQCLRILGNIHKRQNLLALPNSILCLRAKDEMQGIWQFCLVAAEFDALPRISEAQDAALSLYEHYSIEETWGLI